MSQLSHPSVSVPTSVRSHGAILVAALLALVATAAVVLVLSLGGNSPAPQSSPATRSGPDESRTAAAISGGATKPSTGPDESRTAASISGR